MAGKLHVGRRRAERRACDRHSGGAGDIGRRAVGRGFLWTRTRRASWRAVGRAGKRIEPPMFKPNFEHLPETGAWCRDCSTVFRLMFKNKAMSNLVFKKWLMASQEHRILWAKMLVSYLTLKFEGQDRANQAMISSRMQMLDWLFDMLQCPWPGCTVTEVNKDFIQKMLSSAGRFLVKSSDGQTAFGLEPVVFPLGMRNCSRRYLTKPQATRQWPWLAWSSVPPELGTQSSVIGRTKCSMTPRCMMPTCKEMRSPRWARPRLRFPRRRP